VHPQLGRESGTLAPARTVRRYVALWWPYLLVVAMALLVTTLHVARFTQLSPIDETRHLDYMSQLTKGHVVKLGDKLGQEAMRIEACRGIAIPRFRVPPCGSPVFHPRVFRDRGYNNVTAHPPVYYAVTGFPARLMKDAGLSGSILDPARVLGGLWLAAGLVLALRAGELLGIRRLPLVAAAVAILAAPGFLTSFATVNPDAASVFAGGLVLYTAVAWEQDRVRIYWLAVAGGIAAALKMTNFIAVAIVALWFLARAIQPWWERRQGRESDVDGRRYLQGAAVLLASCLAVTLIWIVIASARATIDPLMIPSNRAVYFSSFGWGVALDSLNLFALFPPIGGFTYEGLAKRGPLDLQTITEWLAIAGLMVGLLRVSIRDRLSLIATGSVAVLLSGGIGFMFLTWIANSVIFRPVSRYGLSAIPIVIVLIASLVKTRPARLLISMFAALAISVTIFTLVL
jgi:hypothetical protein